jgi:type II secretory pathway pseudopilin PulG
MTILGKPPREPGNEKGISLIEILIVISIIALTLTSLLGLTALSLNAINSTKQTYEANNIAQELIEQARSFRDLTSWDTDGLGILTTSTDYYIQKSGSPEKWQFVEGTKTIDGFTKKIVLESVKRDGADNIIGIGGTLDSNTKKVTVTVLWQEKNKSHQIELATYLTNWR